MRLRFSPAVFLVLGLVLGACRSSAPEAATEPVGEIPTAEAPAGASTLPDVMLDVEWQLHSVLESEPAAQSVVPQPENYTITFMPDGNAAILADCNSVGATYEVDGTNLTLMTGPSTTAFCGEDSGDQLYLAALEGVTSYDLGEYGMALRVGDTAKLQYIEAEDVIDLPEEEGGVDITADVNVQVRTGPGVHFRISYWASAGDQGEVIGQSPDDEWWVVKFPEDHPHYDRSWVPKSSTSISNPNNEEIPVDIPPLLNPTVYVVPPEGGQPQGKVVERAPIMTGPGNEYQMFGLTSAGSNVVITGKVGHLQGGPLWWQIELPTSYTEIGEGWVEQTYLSTLYADLVQDVFNPPDPADLEARPTASGGSQAAIRFGEKTAVRAGPSSNYDTYIDAEKDWVMGIIGESADERWWVVSLSSTVAPPGYGWVPKDSGTCSKCDVPAPYTPVFPTP